MDRQLEVLFLSSKDCLFVRFSRIVVSLFSFISKKIPTYSATKIIAPPLGDHNILAKIVNKYLHFDIGKSLSVADAIICLTAFAINPFQMVVLGLIATWINGLVVNMFTANLNQRKRVCVVS